MSLTTLKGGTWKRKNVFGGRRRPKNWSSDPRGIKLNFSVSCFFPLMSKLCFLQKNGGFNTHLRKMGSKYLVVLSQALENEERQNA